MDEEKYLADLLQFEAAAALNPNSTAPASLSPDSTPHHPFVPISHIATAPHAFAFAAGELSSPRGFSHPTKIDNRGRKRDRTEEGHEIKAKEAEIQTLEKPNVEF